MCRGDQAQICTHCRNRRLIQALATEDKIVVLHDHTKGELIGNCDKSVHIFLTGQDSSWERIVTFFCGRDKSSQGTTKSG